MKVGEVWELKEKYRDKSEHGDRVTINFLPRNHDGEEGVYYTYLESGIKSALSRIKFLEYFRRDYNA